MKEKSMRKTDRFASQDTRMLTHLADGLSDNLTILSRFEALLLLKEIKQGVKNPGEAIMKMDVLTPELQDEICRMYFQKKRELEGISSSYTMDEIESLDYTDAISPQGKVRYSLPHDLISLILELLKIQEGESLLDFAFCSGDLLLQACLEKDAKATCISDDLEVARVRAAVLGCQASFIPEDSREAGELKGFFEKGFSPVLFAGPRKEILTEKRRAELERALNMDLRRASDEWAVTLKALEMMKPAGWLLTVSSVSQLWREPEREIKETLLKRGWIKAVIKLPDRILPKTRVQPALILYSKTVCSTVRMIDAETLIGPALKNGRPVDEKSRKKILSMMEKDTPFSRTVSVKEIIENGSNLNPESYMNSAPKPKDAVKLLDVVKGITRGTVRMNVPGSDQTGQEEMKVLSSGCIQSGQIDPDLVKTAKVNRTRSVESQTVKEGEILISRNGANLKTAVVPESLSGKAVIDGSLISLELNPEKMNPDYLQAYFESENGTKALNRLSVGMGIKTLSISALERLDVPCPRMEEQKRIAEDYRAACEVFNHVRETLKEAEARRRSVFENHGASS